MWGTRRSHWVLVLLLAVACQSDDGGGGFPGLVADVEVLIDDMGIPHFYGATDEDVFFAAGYQMARDRLVQMELLRLRAHGRWSEVLGEARFEDDRIARLFDWRGLGARDAEGMRRKSPVTWRVVQAWVAGVNRFVRETEEGAAPLPHGFWDLDFRPERWTEADVLVLGKMIGFSNDNRLEQEIFVTLLEKLSPGLLDRVQLLLPMYPVFAVPGERSAPSTRGAPATRPRPVSGPVDEAELLRRLERLHRAVGSLRVMGSNNWAVAGAHTATGRPLIANDPHQPLESPNLMYALHMNSRDGGGTLDVAGFSFAATPGVQLGHSRDVVWTATTNFGDVMDLWEVDFLDDRIVFGGAEHAVVPREEIIKVRGGEDIRVVVLDVPGLGVLLPDDIAPIPVAENGKALLFRWTGMDEGPSREVLLFNQAQSLDEYERAVDSLGAGFNFVSASVDGISYHVGHVIPDRGDVAGKPAPWLVMDGADGRTAWTGDWLPADKLPHVRDPARGWLMTANNDPFGFTADGRVDNDPWYYGAFYAPGFRAKRLADELGRLVTRGAVTLDDMKALQLDVQSVLAPELLPLLAAAHERIGADPALAAFENRPELGELLAVLTAWDGRMARDSAGAVVFHAWLHLLARGVLKDELGFLFEPALDLAAVFVLKVTAQIVLEVYPEAQSLMAPGRDVLLLSALAETHDWLVDRFGSADPSAYTLADQKGTVLQNAAPGLLDQGFFPTDGGEDTVNVSPSTFLDGTRVADRWESRYGPLFRLVATFDETGRPRAWVNTAPGQVADPASPHYDDLRQDWVDGAYRRLAFDRAEIESRLEHRYVLPAGAR